MSNLERKSKRLTKEPDTTEDLDNDQLPDVHATPKGDTKKTAKLPIQESSSSTTPPTGKSSTPKPTAPASTPSSKVTMSDIHAMMVKTATDITNNLTIKHEMEMKSQNDAMSKLENELQALKTMHKTKLTSTETQSSPFETPRAKRPQDLAYQQILNSNKKEVQNTVTDTTTAPTHDKETLSDKTLLALVKMMDASIKNTNSKETTTDLPTFTGKDAQWERWYELLRSYFQAKGWLTTFEHPIGPVTPDNLTEGFDYGINENIYQKIQSNATRELLLHTYE
jgi:hypothetical protein